MRPRAAEGLCARGSYATLRALQESRRDLQDLLLSSRAALLERATLSLARAWRGGLLVVVVIAAASALEVGRRGAAEAAAETGAAAWIWPPDVAAEGRPIAFLAVRDFALPAEQDAIPAQLWILVDEEYQLYLDGIWIGSNHYSLGAEIDRYQLATPLAGGVHRLVVEARSTSGAGGILLALDPGGGRPERIISDDGWSIHLEASPGLIEGRAGTDAGRAPQVWGRPPVGRWHLPSVGPSRGAVEPGPTQWAVDVAPHRLVDAEGDAILGSLIDFGDTLPGYLELWTPVLASDRVEVRMAASVDALDDSPPACFLLPVSGRGRWRAALPRQFRYAWLRAPAPTAARRIAIDSAGVTLSDGAELARERSRGPFGLEPPREGRWSALQREVKAPEKRNP